MSDNRPTDPLITLQSDLAKHLMGCPARDSAVNDCLCDTLQMDWSPVHLESVEFLNQYPYRRSSEDEPERVMTLQEALKMADQHGVPGNVSRTLAAEVRRLQGLLCDCGYVLYGYGSHDPGCPALSGGP